MCITPDGDHWWYQSRFSSNETHELSVFMHLKWYHRRLSSQGGGSTVGFLNSISFQIHMFIWNLKWLSSNGIGTVGLLNLFPFIEGDSENLQLSVFMHLKWYHRRLSSQGGGSTVELLNSIPFRYCTSANSFLTWIVSCFDSPLE